MGKLEPESPTFDGKKPWFPVQIFPTKPIHWDGEYSQESTWERPRIRDDPVLPRDHPNWRGHENWIPIKNAYHTPTGYYSYYSYKRTNWTRFSSLGPHPVGFFFRSSELGPRPVFLSPNSINSPFLSGSAPFFPWLKPPLLPTKRISDVLPHEYIWILYSYKYQNTSWNWSYVTYVNQSQNLVP